MPRPSQWLASVMSGISTTPDMPGSMAEFHADPARTLITDPTESAIAAIFDGAEVFAKALADTETRDRAAQLRLRLEACLNQLHAVHDAACFLEGQL